jgi:hypothetical protein
MRRLVVGVLAAIVGSGCAAPAARPPASPARSEPAAAPAPAAVAGLRPASSFQGIADRAERSRALFSEASRVFLHPRCANCHPDGDTPYQGLVMGPHDPPVARGPDDRGVVGMRCAGCHQDRAVELARIPGAPDWHLAPRGMAWVGKSAHAICEQLKDPGRNGGRTLAQIVEHSAHDRLVGWGWSPGAGREPAPGTQQELGALVAAWVETGADCPPAVNAAAPAPPLGARL